MSTGSRSESVEMYLKTMAELGGEHQPISIGRVAERLNISPVSANEMIKRLGEQHFIQHQPYKGVMLTDHGRKVANSVIRRQRLWECFLVDHLKLEWAKVYDLACDLEHATAPEVTEALADYLGHPTQCPHGNPIPKRDGDVSRQTEIPLANLKLGQKARIQAIRPENGEVMAYLDNKGLRPGEQITVIETAPLNGPLTLQIGLPEKEQTVVLGLNLADLILVEREQ